MKEIKNEELKQINGGGWKIGLIFGAGLVFIIGVIDGFIRPLKCN